MTDDQAFALFKSGEPVTNDVLVCAATGMRVYTARSQHVTTFDELINGSGVQFVPYDWSPTFQEVENQHDAEAALVALTATPKTP